MRLFEIEPLAWQARELVEADIPALQRLFESNGAYHQLVFGRGVQAGDAAEEFAELPPEGMAYRRLWKLGFFDAAGALAGMATVIGDFLVTGVGHIGLFMIDGQRRGSGAASYAALERWMREAEGTQWLRLGIVKGNGPAERFWARCGYTQLRERGPVEYGLRQNMIRVMMKPLNGGVSSDYLALVERDRPETP